MKTKNILYGMMAAACCWACADNDEGEPSHLEKNWYIIEYNPNATPLEQEIYNLYDETGIPIFLTDTLGSQIRYDQGGNPYTYYRTFSPGYNYTNYQSTYTYSLERDEEDLNAMVDLLGNYVLRPFFRKDYGEGFKGKFGPHALIVLDSISKGTAKNPDTLLMDLGEIGLSTRYTLKTGSSTSAANFTAAKDLTEEQKEKFAWCFTMYELDRYLRNTYINEYAAYHIILRSIPQEYTGTGTPTPFQLNLESADYSTSGSTGRRTYNVKDYNMDVNEPRKYGILGFYRNNGSSVYFPNWQEDLNLYMKMIYTKTDAEIRAENADFPYVIQRYEALLALIQQAGLTQFIYDEE